MAMPAGEAAALSGVMPPAVPAATTVPAGETATVPGIGPVGACHWRAMEAVRRSDKSGPGVAETSDGRTRSHCCEAAGYVTAIPPFGSDGREGQDGRADEEREGRRCKNHKRGRSRNDNLGGR